MPQEPTPSGTPPAPSEEGGSEGERPYKHFVSHYEMLVSVLIRMRCFNMTSFEGFVNFQTS